MIIDATLKRIFQRPPNRLLSLATGEEIVVERSLPTESIIVTNLHPDTLFETRDGRIVHAELHGYDMEEFAVRNLIYFGLILRDYRRPPVQIVFWTGNRKVGLTEGLNFKPRLQFEYLVVDVRDIDGQLLLDTPEVGESIFSILCKHADDREAVRKILSRIRELPREQHREAVTQLLVLSGLRGLTNVVKTEVAKVPVSIDIHENEFLEEVWQEGRQEGRNEGRQEGRREGRQEGARESLLEILEVRFGPLGDEVRTRIASADLATVHLWTRRAIASRDLSEVIDE